MPSMVKTVGRFPFQADSKNGTSANQFGQTVVLILLGSLANLMPVSQIQKSNQTSLSN